MTTGYQAYWSMHSPVRKSVLRNSGLAAEHCRELPTQAFANEAVPRAETPKSLGWKEHSSGPETRDPRCLILQQPLGIEEPLLLDLSCQAVRLTSNSRARSDVQSCNFTSAHRVMLHHVMQCHETVPYARLQAVMCCPVMWYDRNAS